MKVTMELSDLAAMLKERGNVDQEPAEPKPNYELAFKKSQEDKRKIWQVLCDVYNGDAIRHQDTEAGKLMQEHVQWLHERLAFEAADAKRWRWVRDRANWCGFISDGVACNVNLWTVPGTDGRITGAKGKTGDLETAVDVAMEET